MKNIIIVLILLTGCTHRDNTVVNYQTPDLYQMAQAQLFCRDIILTSLKRYKNTPILVQAQGCGQIVTYQRRLRHTAIFFHTTRNSVWQLVTAPTIPIRIQPVVVQPTQPQVIQQNVNVNVYQSPQPIQ